MSSLTIGSTFLDRYRIDQVVGRGAFAKVFRARQLDLGRDVALKVLSPVTNRPDKMAEAKLRFEREAKLVARLQDPHTIHLFDWGTSPDGEMYMVTEFINGRTLHDVWIEADPMPWARVVRIIIQVLYSLQEAHDLGVLHRDIKPSNIMLFDRPGRPDQVKVLDFGIAKAFETSDAADEDSMKMALTARGRVVGTPGYMAPEQLRGEPLTPGTDMYSVGIIALELLTAEPAFKSRDDFETAAMRLDTAPLKVPEDLDVPHVVRDTIDGLLVKPIDARLSRAADAIEALSSATSDAPTQPVDDEILLTEPAEPRHVEAPTTGMNPAIIGAAVVILLILVILTALAL